MGLEFEFAYLSARFSSTYTEFAYLSRKLHEPCLSLQADGSKEPMLRGVDCGIEEEAQGGKWVGWILMSVLPLAGCVAWMSLLVCGLFLLI